MQEKDQDVRVGVFADLAQAEIDRRTTAIVLATLPRKGEVVVFRGLNFEVKFVNRHTGEMRLRLRGLVEAET